MTNPFADPTIHRLTVAQTCADLMPFVSLDDPRRTIPVKDYVDSPESRRVQAMLKAYTGKGAL